MIGNILGNIHYMGYLVSFQLFEIRLNPIVAASETNKKIASFEMIYKMHDIRV